MKKIAILTSGGDAPGMNPAICAIVKAARFHNIEAYLVYNGYKGLVEGQIVPASQVPLNHYLNQGGTCILSARYPEFKEPAVREKAKQQLDRLGIDALVVIGGDGSYKGAQLLDSIGVKTIALPGTIDNDIASTEFTIGFDTTFNTIVETLDRLRDTSRSHSRAMLVEVMGRYAGDLAVYSGVATGAELIITSENKMDIKEIIKVVDHQMNQLKKDSMLVIITEHVYSNLEAMAKEIEQATGVCTRSNVLAYLQRGGRPSAMERYLATQMGDLAVNLLVAGKSGLAIGINKNELTATPILEALALPKTSYLEKIKKFNEINQK